MLKCFAGHWTTWKYLKNLLVFKEILTQQFHPVHISETLNFSTFNANSLSQIFRHHEELSCSHYAPLTKLIWRSNEVRKEENHSCINFGKLHIFPSFLSHWQLYWRFGLTAENSLSNKNQYHSSYNYKVSISVKNKTTLNERALNLRLVSLAS